MGSQIHRFFSGVKQVNQMGIKWWYDLIKASRHSEGLDFSMSSKDIGLRIFLRYYYNQVSESQIQSSD